MCEGAARLVVVSSGSSNEVAQRAIARTELADSLSGAEFLPAAALGVRLLNGQEIAKALNDPRSFGDENRRGTAELAMAVDADGQVIQAHLSSRSPELGFNANAKRLARRMRFSPAIHQGCRRAFITVMPFWFSVGPSPR